jgi:hypothetical protein
MGLIGGIGLWALIALGAALVSGAHSVPAIFDTIPAVVSSPAREILSLFGFTILELMIFAGAMYRHETRYALGGLLVGLVGALAANIGSSVDSVAALGGDGLKLTVAIVLALIAPLAAFLAGEMCHKLYMQHQGYVAKLLAEWEVKRKELDAVINREFTKLEKLRKADGHGRTTTAPVSALSPADGQRTDGGHGYGVGYSKRTDADERVRAHLERHPGDINMNVRDLAAKVGVGKTKVAEVVREMKLRQMDTDDGDTEPVSVGG